MAKPFSWHGPDRVRKGHVGSNTHIEVQVGVGPTDLWVLGGGLPGPPLVGLTPTQAIKFRAFSPEIVCRRFWIASGF